MLDLSRLANRETMQLLGNAIYLLIWLAREGNPQPVPGEDWAPLFGGGKVPWEKAQQDLGVQRSRRYDWVRYLRAAGLIRERDDGSLEIAASLLVNPVSGNPENRTQVDPKVAGNVSDIPESRTVGQLNPDNQSDDPENRTQVQPKMEGTVSDNPENRTLAPGPSDKSDTTPSSQTRTEPVLEGNVSDFPESRTPSDLLPPHPPPIEIDIKKEEEEEEEEDALRPPGIDLETWRRLKRWRKWDRDTFLGMNPPNEARDTIELAIIGGMDPEVVIRVVRQVLQERGPRAPLQYAATIISSMYAAGIRTLEQAEAYWQKREEKKLQRAARKTADTQPTRPRRPPLVTVPDDFVGGYQEE